MTEKPSNPKDAVGIKKAYRSTVPAPILWEVGCAMLEGALKYGRHNYRAIGVRSSVYYDACCRHLDQWWEGEDLDPDSGLPHLAKAIACLVVIRDAQMRGAEIDDRPLKTEDGWMKRINDIAAELIKKYPDPKPAYTERDRDQNRSNAIYAKLMGPPPAKDDTKGSLRALP